MLHRLHLVVIFKASANKNGDLRLVISSDFPSPKGEGVKFNRTVKGRTVLFLMKDFLGYQPFEVWKFICHVRQLHGFHKFLLEIAFHCQFNIFDIT